MEYFKPQAGTYKLLFTNTTDCVLKLTFAESRMMHKLKDQLGICSMMRQTTESDRIKEGGRY